MNINFGLMPPVTVEREAGKKMQFKDKTIARKRAYTSRAMTDFKAWLENNAVS